MTRTVQESREWADGLLTALDASDSSERRQAEVDIYDAASGLARTVIKLADRIAELERDYAFCAAQLEPDIAGESGDVTPEGWRRVRGGVEYTLGYACAYVLWSSDKSYHWSIYFDRRPTVQGTSQSLGAAVQAVDDVFRG